MDRDTLEAAARVCESAEHYELGRKLRALSAQEGDGWIPVSERLPEDSTQEYLVSVSHYGVLRGVTTAFYYKTRPDGWSPYGRDITHWRPLPAPPNTAAGSEDRAIEDYDRELLGQKYAGEKLDTLIPQEDERCQPAVPQDAAPTAETHPERLHSESGRDAGQSVAAPIVLPRLRRIKLSSDNPTVLECYLDSDVDALRSFAEQAIEQLTGLRLDVGELSRLRKIVGEAMQGVYDRAEAAEAQVAALTDLSNHVLSMIQWSDPVAAEYLRKKLAAARSRKEQP